MYYFVGQYQKLQNISSKMKSKSEPLLRPVEVQPLGSSFI